MGFGFLVFQQFHLKHITMKNFIISLVFFALLLSCSKQEPQPQKSLTKQEVEKRRASARWGVRAELDGQWHFQGVYSNQYPTSNSQWTTDYGCSLSSITTDFVGAGYSQYNTLTIYNGSPCGNPTWQDVLDDYTYGGPNGGIHYETVSNGSTITGTWYEQCTSCHEIQLVRTNGSSSIYKDYEYSFSDDGNTLFLRTLGLSGSDYRYIVHTRITP